MIKFKRLKDFVNNCRSLSLFLSIKAYSRNISHQVKNWATRQECVHIRKEGVIATFERGLYNVYTPYSELIHYESISRFEDKGLERDEINAIKLRKKWPQYIEYMGGRDPFYNDNLSYAHEDFRIRRE